MTPIPIFSILSDDDDDTMLKYFKIKIKIF